MEEGGINRPHKRRQKEKVITLERSETFPSTRQYPQRVSSGQAITQHNPSSFPSSSQTQLDDQEASNVESDSLTNHRQAGDASLEDQWRLFIKIHPSLISFL